MSTYNVNPCEFSYVFLAQQCVKMYNVFFSASFDEGARGLIFTQELLVNEPGRVFLNLSFVCWEDERKNGVNST